MKRLVVAIAVFSVLFLGLTSESFAQRGPRWQGSGGWGPGTPYQRLYNPSTAETISGTVEAVQKVTPMKGMYPAIELLVKTDKESIPVHVGPEWYVTRLDTKLAKGDTIEVKGSRVTLAGKPVIIAAEIKKGDNVLVLRDNTGVPVWSGWRR